jgi:acetyltransferase-like isoleucine patch superfamily enzyme
MHKIIKIIIEKFMFSKRLCVIGKHSVLYKTASITNNLKIRERIRIGDYCHIKGELLLFGHGGQIELGDYCYVGLNTFIWSAKNIKIGNRVLISHNCNIFDNDTHPLDPDARHRQFVEIITKGHPQKIDIPSTEVYIEDDVLIAANSTILKGVQIGRGAIIGAGSVVTKSVPPFTIVAGNPAIVIGAVDRAAPPR